MNHEQSANPTPIWRFWVPLLFQTALIVSVPAQAVYTNLTGKTVILQTVPSDPYNPLLGYSQKLSYDISHPESLRTLPGWKELLDQQAAYAKKYPQPGTGFYVILERPPQITEGLPQPWKPVGVRRDRPHSLPANQVALKALSQDGFIEYGLETYYMPEDQRNQLNKELDDAQKQKPNQKQLRKKLPIVMEVKVDPQGQAVPVSLWVRARQFRF